MDETARDGALVALSLIETLVVLEKKRLGRDECTRMLDQIEEMRDQLRGARDPSETPEARRVVASVAAREYWGY
jgi:hypothetical protein